jgi:hypothetical protein
MYRQNNTIEFILLILKCFLVLFLFGLILPQLLDNLLYYFFKSNIYDNSVFVNFLVDKNKKILYNYIYIIKIILHNS